MCKLANWGSGNGLKRSSAGVANLANSTAEAPPSMQRTAFSARSRRRIRQRVAPSAARKLVSRRRAMERVSSRLRIFAETITRHQADGAHQKLERGAHLAYQRVVKIENAHRFILVPQIGVDAFHL